MKVTEDKGIIEWTGAIVRPGLSRQDLDSHDKAGVSIVVRPYGANLHVGALWRDGLNLPSYGRVRTL